MTPPIFSEYIRIGETQFVFDFYMDVESDPQNLGRLRHGLTFSFWA